MKTISLIILFFLTTSIFSQKSNINAERVDDPIEIINENNVIIKGKRISNLTNLNNGHCLTLTNCKNIIIEDCIFESSIGNGINIEKCSNITVKNCSFESNQTGIYALSSEKIQILNNKFSNPRGPFPRGQFVQFNDVTGASNMINNNVGECDMGLCNAEDLINIFNSKGTVEDPIQIVGNMFRGGSTSVSGGGIMTGDMGGENILVKDNILVNPGQYGIAIASGKNIKIENNKVYSKPYWFNNVGIYTWNQYEIPCSSNSVIENKVYYINPKVNSITNDLWINTSLNGDCGTYTDKNTLRDSNLDESILPKELLTPDLMLHYTFDNDLNDKSGNNLNGINNSLTFTKNKEISSADFNGNHSYVSLESNKLLKPENEKISIAVWIKPENFSKNNNQCIAMSPDSNGLDTGWSLFMNESTLHAKINIIDRIYKDNSIELSEKFNYNIATNTLNKNMWNFVVFTYNGNEMHLYIDGELKSSINIPKNNNVDYTDYNQRKYYSRKINYSEKNSMKIGHSDGNNYFQGGIADFKLYRGILSETVIKETYSESKILYNIIPNNSDSSANKKVSIYPTPTNGVINIDYPDNEKSTKIQILDLNGQLLLTKDTQTQNSIVDITNFQEGMFLLNIIKNEKVVKTEKIIKK